jgi:dihydrofolate reductase
VSTAIRWNDPRLHHGGDGGLPPSSRLREGDLVEAVKSLKRADDLTVPGSENVAAQLGEAGLVDRYQFVMVPIDLGGGRTVFIASSGPSSVAPFDPARSS